MMRERRRVGQTNAGQLPRPEAKNCDMPPSGAGFIALLGRHPLLPAGGRPGRPLPERRVGGTTLSFDTCAPIANSTSS